MPVTNVDKDADARTMTITTELDAAPDRAWQLWDDPRQLERWWGPPTYPATFVDHELAVGAVTSYFMTGPEGDRSHGWWRVLSVDPPHALEFEDGFADEQGDPNPGMPTMVIRVRLHERAGGTRMEVETSFPSAEAMEQMIAMGMAEGMEAAMGQIDALLEAGIAPG